MFVIGTFFHRYRCGVPCQFHKIFRLFFGKVVDVFSMLLLVKEALKKKVYYCHTQRHRLQRQSQLSHLRCCDQPFHGSSCEKRKRLLRRPGTRGGGSWALYWGGTYVYGTALLHIYVSVYRYMYLCAYLDICVFKYLYISYVHQVGNGRNQSVPVQFAEDLQTRSNCKAATNSRRQLPTS